MVLCAVFLLHGDEFDWLLCLILQILALFFGKCTVFLLHGDGFGLLLCLSLLLLEVFFGIYFCHRFLHISLDLTLQTLILFALPLGLELSPFLLFHFSASANF